MNKIFYIVVYVRQLFILHPVHRFLLFYLTGVLRDWGTVFKYKTIGSVVACLSSVTGLFFFLRNSLID